ncbi:19480_t:CDS:1, partial [Cetraspora pellucida]
MCDKNTKQLIVKSPTLQDPNNFFDKYWNEQHDFFIDEKEKIYVVKKDNDKVLDIFSKSSLKKYLESSKQDYRFNTCPCCGKIKLVFVEKTNLLIKETINHCDVYNSPFTNQVKEDFKMRFLDHEHLSKFFDHYGISRKCEIYLCKHKNLSVYRKNK